MPKGSRVDQDTIQRIISMTQTGSTQYEISEALGISVSTIGKYQKQNNVTPACHWGHGGLYSQNMTLAPKMEERPLDIPSGGKPLELDKLIVANKEYTIVGAGTNFKYVISTHGSQIRIDFGYSEPIEIDPKDILAFAEELVQVGKKLEEMKKNVW